MLEFLKYFDIEKIIVFLSNNMLNNTKCFDLETIIEFLKIDIFILRIIMLEVFKKLGAENMIAIIGIALQIFSASIAFIFKMIADSKKRNEELRPNVFISYDWFRKNGIYYETMTLKNYGQTSAEIISIEISPKIKNNGENDFMPNTFTTIKNFPLAPQQKITTNIGASGESNWTIKREKRHFKITYKNSFFNKTYISEYDVDETAFPTLLSDNE
jgi:hypothetical protein